MSIFPSWTTEQKYLDEHKLNLGADMTDEILLDIHNRVANITFNRPDQHNAIAYEGWLRLIDIVNQIKLDPDIRVVVFNGAGSRSFSAGADIKDFDSHRYDSASSKVYSEAFDGALDEIETLSMPTISKIRGICVGGGCELSMATDIRIASEDSKFGIPVAKLGILVGYREMKRLINLVGQGNASYILLSGRIVGAKEAERMGLITKTVSNDSLDEAVKKLIAEMVPLAPLSQSRHKEILQKVVSNQSLEGFTTEEAHLPFTNFDSQDFNEGKSAFVDRRSPIFKGL